MEVITKLFFGIILIFIAVSGVAGLVLFIIGLTKENKKNSLTLIGGIVSVICGILFFILNPNGPSKITTDIEGIYKFQYPTGQVEVIFIMKDSTFIQTIYKNNIDFLNKSNSLYKNSGTWTTSGNELEFDKWLVFCEFRDPKNILTNPYLATMLNISWYEANSNHRELISIYSEKGYVFEKIEKLTYKQGGGN